MGETNFRVLVLDDDETVFIQWLYVNHSAR